MDIFKINRDAAFSLQQAMYEETTEKEREGLIAAADNFKRDISRWEIITVLYSYSNELSGELFHFVRIDHAHKNFDGKIAGYSTHAEISDSRLTWLKSLII